MTQTLLENNSNNTNTLDENNQSTESLDSNNNNIQFSNEIEVNSSTFNNLNSNNSLIEPNIIENNSVNSEDCQQLNTCLLIENSTINTNIVNIENNTNLINLENNNNQLNIINSKLEIENNIQIDQVSNLENQDKNEISEINLNNSSIDPDSLIPSTISSNSTNSSNASKESKSNPTNINEITIEIYGEQVLNNESINDEIKSDIAMPLKNSSEDINEKFVSGDEVKPMKNGILLDFVADQLTSATKRPEANIFPSSIPLINMLFILYSGISPSYLPKINPPTKFLFSTDTGINLGEFRSNGTQDGLLKNIMNMYISPFGTFTSHLNDSNGNIVPSIDILPSMKNAESRIFDEIYINKGSITDIGIINLSTWNTTLSSSEGLNYEFSYDNLSRTDFCNYVSRSSAAMNCHGWMENEMMNMLHQRYIYEATSKQLILQSNAKEMPFFQTEISFRLGDLLAYFFFPLILVLLLPVFMYHIVKEKETGVREMMYLMSMKTRNYVGVQYFFNYIIYILVALEFVLFAVIFKFKLIAETTPLLTFLTLSGWGFTLVSVSFFFSAFLHKTSFASILGYVFVIVSPSAAVVFQQHILCNRSEIEFTCPAAMKPFLLLFPLPLTHIIYSASTDCLKGKCPNKASDVVNNVELLWGILFLFLNGFIYLVLGLYFEKVLKQPTGVPKHPLFPLQYLWNFTIGRFFKNKQRKGSSFGKKPIIDQHENIDVKNMREKIQKQEITPDVCGVLVDGLVKTYKNNVAVKGVYLEVGFNENLKVMKNQKTSDQDKNIELNNIDENPIESNNLKPMKCSGVLGLLGENGAGKTSIIKILVGFQKASGGTAYIDGNCINGGFEPIYKSLGYCGQFDNSLWSDLTSYETLLFYARLKGVPFLKQRQHVIALLKSVGLWKDRNRSVSHLTSGLKRCLSIAISLIGNPSVVILDEPTGSINSVTAMQIWSLIIKEKKNRCFIITTHNMEEASAVSDQICIMAHGRIKAYGTNEHLKAVFGSGYELGIVLQESKHSEDCIAFIKELIPTSSLVHAFSEHLHFSIPKSDVILSKIFKDIESNKQNIGIKNWSLKSTTVEDVFINVVQAADQEHSEEQVKQTEKVTWWTRILSLVRMIYN